MSSTLSVCDPEAGVDPALEDVIENFFSYFAWMERYPIDGNASGVVRVPPLPDEIQPDEWAQVWIDELIQHNPHRALTVIVRLVAAAPTAAAREYVAASVLEDLIVEAGPLVIQEIEHEIQSNPSFREAMLACWASSATAEVQRRISTALTPWR